MLITLISTFLIGGCAALAVLIVNHLGGKIAGFRLPGWAMPVAVGLAMIVFTIWSEYTWYGRTMAQLPETMAVASAPEERNFYRPWTYVAPLVSRFIAVDRAPAQGGGDTPFATRAHVFARWSPVRTIPVAVDCAGGRRADLIGGGQVTADGTLAGADWLVVPPDDPLMRAACNGG